MDAVTGSKPAYFILKWDGARTDCEDLVSRDRSSCAPLFFPRRNRGGAETIAAVSAYRPALAAKESM